MKKMILLASATLTLLVVAGRVDSVHACPYPDPADPRNAACAPATTVASPTTSTQSTTSTTSTTVLPASTTSVVAPSSTSSTISSVSPVSTVVIPEGDVPPRLRPCPNPQYPGSGGVITSCHGLPATGVSPWVAGALFGATFGLLIGVALLTLARAFSERGRRPVDDV